MCQVSLHYSRSFDDLFCRSSAARLSNIDGKLDQGQGRSKAGGITINGQYVHLFNPKYPMTIFYIVYDWAQYSTMIFNELWNISFAYSLSFFGYICWSLQWIYTSVILATGGNQKREEQEREMQRKSGVQMTWILTMTMIQIWWAWDSQLPFEISVIQLLCCTILYCSMWSAMFNMHLCSFRFFCSLD